MRPRKCLAELLEPFDSASVTRFASCLTLIADTVELVGTARERAEVADLRLTSSVLDQFRTILEKYQ